MAFVLSVVKNPTKGMKVRFMIHGGYKQGIIIGIKSDDIQVGHITTDVHYNVTGRRVAIRKASQLTMVVHNSRR